MVDKLKPVPIQYKDFEYGRYCDEQLWIGKTVKIKIPHKEETIFRLAVVKEILKDPQNPHKIQWKDNDK